MLRIHYNLSTSPKALKCQIYNIAFTYTISESYNLCVPATTITAADTEFHKKLQVKTCFHECYFHEIHKQDNKLNDT